MRLLNKINSPEDLRQLSPEQLPEVAAELREFIIDIVATKEGHLGASLGVTELTIALHYLFNTPYDKLIWDVGHQAYGHKLLTGRKDQFHTNRQWEGISGFPKMSESPYDAFGTGHSSTSISALLGMALASKIKGETDRHHIAVIGDASIASGMAFEALNHAGVADADLLVILNDNAIGIDPSVGALKRYLTNVKKGTAKDENLFECLNFHYCGPVDGHDLPALLAAINEIKSIKGPRLLHLITTKGKGLEKAEKNQVLFHAPGKFDKATGELLSSSSEGSKPLKFQDIFGKTLVELAGKNEAIVGITPAMPTGSSLKFMMEAFPERSFDVGIAEQHAVTLAAGMAAEGLVPFCAIYSTFLQRAYDQVIHDVALQNLPVIFCLDRAGLVGQDGPTHHGVFDLAYLRCIPNLKIAAPMSGNELRNLMYTAQLGLDGPLAIRYPRGRVYSEEPNASLKEIPFGKATTLSEGVRVVILSTGPLGWRVKELLSTQKEFSIIGHYHFGFVKPLDKAILQSIFNQYSIIITIEDGCITGGFGSAISEIAASKGYAGTIHRLGIPDRFIAQGTPEELHWDTGLDRESIKEFLEQIIADEPN